MYNNLEIGGTLKKYKTGVPLAFKQVKNKRGKTCEKTYIYFVFIKCIEFSSSI